MKPEIKKTNTFQDQTKVVLDQINKKCKKSSCKWFKKYARLFFAVSLSPVEKETLVVVKKGCSTFAPHRWCTKRNKVDEITLRGLRESHEGIE